MKYMFVMMCVVAALGWSAFVVSWAGRDHVERPDAESWERLPGVPSLPLTEQTRAVDSLMQEVIAHREALERKELLLDEREAGVRQEEFLLVRMRDELRELQREMDRMADRHDVEIRGNIRKIAEFYARMDGANAARLLNEMEIEVAASILAELQDRQAAAIMDAAAAMGADGIERAVQWTEAIRKRRSERVAETESAGRRE